MHRADERNETKKFLPPPREVLFPFGSPLGERSVKRPIAIFSRRSRVTRERWFVSIIRDARDDISIAGNKVRQDRGKAQGRSFQQRRSVTTRRFVFRVDRYLRKSARTRRYSPRARAEARARARIAETSDCRKDACAQPPKTRPRGSSQR